MKPGDKLYRCFNGPLEQATFISQGLADSSCTSETYLLRAANGEVFRCSMNMYHLSRHDALSEYVARCKEARIDVQRQTKELLKQRMFLEDEIVRVNRELAKEPKQC